MCLRAFNAATREEPMNYEELELLLDYHYWAQHRMFDALALLSAEQWSRPLESSFQSICDTAAHNWAGERVWCSRWQGVSPGGLQSSNHFPPRTRFALLLS